MKRGVSKPNSSLYFAPIWHNSKMRFQINGNDIEFVEYYKRLGHIINSAFDDHDEGIADERADFYWTGK
jgi:hypothetical protein